MQLVLGRAHEELKERNQAPSVARKQLVSETFFHLLDILDTSNQPVILVQQHITLSIQLRHHPSHFAVLALPRCASASSLSGHQHVAHKRTEHRQLTATSAPSMLRESRYARLLRTCKPSLSI